jgi:hypothetical protein
MKTKLDLDVVNINKDGSALGVIPLICKNGLYNMKMGNLLYKLLLTSTIATIGTVDPTALHSQG